MGGVWTARRAFFCFVLGLLDFLGHFPAAEAQGVPPFSPPIYTNNLALGYSAVSALDLNRDGSPEFFSPGFVFMHLMASFDENGELLGTGLFRFMNGPSNPPGAIPMPTSTASGDLDGDGREDLVITTTTGSVHVLPNAGVHQLNQFSFLPDTMIDNYGVNYTINPPFIVFKNTFTKVIDVDSDGLNDVVASVSPLDMWGAGTFPGELSFYKNSGNGLFVKNTLITPGNIVDASWADVDGNGTPDHLVYVTETGRVGAFSTELHHAAWSGGLWTEALPPQIIGLQKITALGLIDTIGTSAPDYLFSVTFPGSPNTSAVYTFEGDGLGNMSPTSWNTLPLPATTQPLGDHILSMHVSDYDKDGNKDLAILRGYSDPGIGPFGNPSFGNDEIIYFSGPNLSATPSLIPINGYTDDSWTSNRAFSVLPLWSCPEMLHAVDFGRDRAEDFMIGRVIQGQISAVVTLKNTTPWRMGDPAIEKIGTSSGGDPLVKARIGFEGDPIVGNAHFAVTLQNLRSGSLVGLMWGSYATPAAFNMYGIDFNVLPEVFGNLGAASGSSVTDGFFSVSLPIPNSPALIGDTGNFQYNYFHPTTGRFGGTQGSHLVIGR